MVNRKVGKLEIVFIDKEGKWYPLDEVDREDLAEGLEKVSKEVAKRLQLLKDQRQTHFWFSVPLQLKYTLAVTRYWRFYLWEVSLSLLPAKWEEFLKGLADEHDIDVSKVISGLCEWAFSSAEYKVQFEVWLDKAYPPKGQAEDRANVAGEEASEAEEKNEDEAEEEAHEDRDYSEDRDLKP